MKVSCVMNGWVLREKNVNPPSLSFSRLASVYIDGNEVVIQLKINPLTTEVSLKSFLGNTLTHETFGFKANENKNLPFTLDYLACFSVCCGLPANDHNNPVVRKDSDEMCTQVKIGSWTAYLPPKYHQVVPSLGETCVECGYLKRLLSQKKRHTPISWIPKTLLWVTKKSWGKWILFWEREMLNGKRSTGERNLNLSAWVPQMKSTLILNPCWVLWTPPK